MDRPSELYIPTSSGGYPDLIPVATITTGVIFLLVAAVQAVTTVQDGTTLAIAVLDFVFFAAPGATLVYTGFWMPRSNVGPKHYPRLIAWMLGGVAVMFGFILLRDIHPGVSVGWSTGTQAIALTLGSIGGLLIGIQETRATIRTTQLRERTDALVSREQELERKNDRLEEFASVISHDLRNPLNVAQGHLELARGEIENEHLTTVADAHDRMTRLIEDLLTLAREGDTIDETEPVDLAALGEACRQNLAATEATLSVRIDRTVVADRDRLRQLLENLIRNSVEHSSTGPRSQAHGDNAEHSSASSRTKSGDSVEHSSTSNRAEPDDNAEHSSASSRTKSGDSVEHGSTSNRAEPDDSVEHGSTGGGGDSGGATRDGGTGVAITVGELDDRTGFYVEDDGPGIPEADREQIFEGGYSTSDSGTGFGLRIVEQITDAHGWSVRATEGTDGGARFEFTGVDFEE